MALIKASAKSAACKSSRVFLLAISTWTSTSLPLEFRVRYALIWKGMERQLAHMIYRSLRLLLLITSLWSRIIQPNLVAFPIWHWTIGNENPYQGDRDGSHREA